MVFERLERRIARLKAEDPAVAMDHDIHEVGILESDRGPSERLFIELPAGRPSTPLRSCAALTASWRRIALEPCAASATRRASEAESSTFNAALRYGGDERAQVGEHQVGLLQGSEVPTRRNLAPVNDIVGLLGKRARWWQKHRIGERRNAGRHPDACAGPKCLRTLQTLAVINPGRGHNRRRRDIEHDIGEQLLLRKLAPNVRAAVGSR